MHQTIKLENGDGRSVSNKEIRGEGKNQVTYHFQDVLEIKIPWLATCLPHDWNNRNQIKIIN
tara:strand:+ start:204 stop:389 length:186 start_codon:yes stop_codon:yes gene_type:complete